MLRLLSIGGACLALALAGGCGGDNGDSGGSAGGGDGGGGGAYGGGGSGSETSTTSASAGGGKTITVRMKDFAFSPAEVQAKVGDTIKWVNDDSAPHNAVGEGTDLKTETIEKGGEVTYEVDSAESIDYICTIHPNMKGTITATE